MKLHQLMETLNQIYQFPEVDLSDFVTNQRLDGALSASVTNTISVWKSLINFWKNPQHPGGCFSSFWSVISFLMMHYWGPSKIGANIETKKSSFLQNNRKMHIRLVALFAKHNCFFDFSIILKKTAFSVVVLYLLGSFRIKL